MSFESWSYAIIHLFSKEHLPSGFPAALPISCTCAQLQPGIWYLVFIFPHDLISHILIQSLLAITGAFPVTSAEAGPGGPVGEEALQWRVCSTTVFPHSEDAHEFQGECLNYISILLFSLQLLITELQQIKVVWDMMAPKEFREMT